MTWPGSPELFTPLGPWFQAHHRSLPWRDEDLDRRHPDAYAVLVSELMLQQTQVATVIPYFRRWMELFPDAGSLGKADSDAVHKAWEGLGYYRRARHLHAAAASIAEHGWPSDLEGLLELPGLGPYTAAAVASIAFQWPEPALDGNAFRVLARLLAIEDNPRTLAGPLRAWLRPALLQFGPSRITQGLMELGATVCLPLPRCEVCPLNPRCEARRMKATDRIPQAVRRTHPKELNLWLVALEAEGHWLMLEPASQGLLAGLWTWPRVTAAEAPQAAFAAETALPYSAVEVREWPGWSQVYTHRRELVSPLHFRLTDRFEVTAGLRWIPDGQLDSLALGKRDSKLRSLLKSQGVSHPETAILGQILSSITSGAGLAG